MTDSLGGFFIFFPFFYTQKKNKKNIYTNTQNKIFTKTQNKIFSKTSPNLKRYIARNVTELT
jgi:hypothetical protein